MELYILTGMVLLLCFLVCLGLIYNAVQVDYEEFPDKYHKNEMRKIEDT